MSASPRATWTRSGAYLAAVREANPGVGGSPEDIVQHYRRLAAAILEAPLGRHLRDGSEEAYLDLRVALVLLAVHEGFSGFIMTGEAADFMAAIMAPHSFRLQDPGVLVEGRNGFVRDMAQRDELLGIVASAPGGTLRSLEMPEEPISAASSTSSPSCRSAPGPTRSTRCGI